VRLPAAALSFVRWPAAALASDVWPRAHPFTLFLLLLVLLRSRGGRLVRMGAIEALLLARSFALAAAPGTA
jgi:hypothetical protein